VVHPGAGAREPAASYVDGVPRPLTTRMDPVVGARSVTAARIIDIVRAVGVVVVTITVSLARPGPATAGPRGTAIAVLLATSAAAWIAWILTDDRDRLNAATLVVMGAAGALGYLTKDATRAEIGRAVVAAAAGQAVLDPAVQQRLLLAAARAPAPQPDQDHDPDELTPRESDVLRLIAEGKSNREIARALYVSEATVKTHVNRIFAKTGSRDRTQAVRYAYTHGYANPARSS
jgi:DNA-binding NarL/FixJ family response regulator